MKCARCGRELTSDETGLSRKLINRGTEVFFCLDCLGDRFGISEVQLRELIATFRAAGCTLFPPDSAGSVQEDTCGRLD